MKKLTSFRYHLLTWFSQPACDRSLYKLIHRWRPTSIMEIGLASVERSQNIIQVAQRANEGAEIRFCGIDLFDARPQGPVIALKKIHTQLAKTGAKVRLMPGEFHTALPRLANQLGAHDLVIVTTDQAVESIAPVWFFVPRILSESGHVLLRDPSNSQAAFLPLSQAEVAKLATKQTPGQKQAA